MERINALIKVVEEASFAKAAKILNKTTAAVSLNISALERELGVQLLSRSTRRVAPTELGRQYYEAVKKGLEGFHEAAALVTAVKQEPQGRIKIVTSHYFADRFILQYLPEFRRRYPKVVIDLELAERFPNFDTEKVDLVFGISIKGEPENLVRRQIAKKNYIFCAAPSYLKTHGVPIKPEDLKKHNYIMHSIRRPQGLIEFTKHASVMVEPILFLNDIRAMRECAIRGMGIIKIHDYLAKEAIDAKKLVEVLPGYGESDEPMYLYYQAQRYLDPKIRAFIDFYIEKIAS